ncbi:tetratricopeptide repeat protein [Labrys sp. 22185]|uniref:tetratricopeptide repeat protein n=1 Tax=Labrys sp. 22185 TaxID=3453888 RepID=UPI003F8736D6
MENSDEYQALARGLALRRLNRLEEAEQAFMRAIELKPGNVSAFLECGDAWFDANHWERALYWYEGALKLQPDQPWATASALYCRWDQETGDAELDELFALIERGNQRARQIWNEYVSSFPEFYDATAEFWRQGRPNLLKAKKEKPDEENFRVQLKVSVLEAPSNILAMFLDCKAAGKMMELNLQVDAIQTPDPRLPVAPVDYLLWHYHEAFPSPVVDPPREDVSVCIERLARGYRSTILSYADASFTANELGVEAVPDLLAVMVRPPAIPEHSYALAWVPTVQLMAAFVLAQIDTGWEGSHRRKALLSMLFGPSDWITGAAIKALSWIARTEQAYAMDIHEQFLRLEQYIPAMGGCSWYNILYEEWGDLPFQTDAERERYQERLG